MLATIGLAQTPQGIGTETPSHEQIPIELFQAPRPKELAAPDCNGRDKYRDEACSALRGGTEGWVELAFMVDPQGNPFEIAVVRSTGNKKFDDSAAKAIQRSTFNPASLDGKPIESAFEFKYLFSNGAHSAAGAGSQFVREYKSLLVAVNSGDRAAADASQARLKISNLYEDAYYGLAT